MDELKTLDKKQDNAKKGVDLAHGSLATALTSGESKSKTAKNGAVSDPYDVFNYYSDGLKGSYFGKLDNKRISEMTIGDIQKLSKSGSTLNISYIDGDKPVKRTGRLFAVGRFQLVPDTLKGAKTKLKYSDSTVFSKAIQDECFSKYLITGLKGRAAIIDYISGKTSGQVALDAAARAAAQEWASVGIKPGSSAGNGTKGAANGLTTYYVGTQNRASISYNAICKALNEDRAAVASGGIAQRTVDDQPNVQADAEVKADNKVDDKKASDNAAPKYALTAMDKTDYVITGSGLNIRTAPDSSTKATLTGRTLSANNKVSVIGYHITNGTKWLAIIDSKGVNTDAAGNSYSWISSNYAKPASATSVPKENNSGKKITIPGGSTIMSKSYTPDLDLLSRHAAQEGFDVKDVATSANYVAKYCTGGSSQSQCTRGTALFLQLASYARGEAKAKYASACAAHLFGSANPMTNYNISASVAGEFTKASGSNKTGKSSMCSYIEKNITKDGEFVTFQYGTSQHIVFRSGGKWYSDFKQGTAAGCGGDKTLFSTVHFFTK